VRPAYTKAGSDLVIVSRGSALGSFILKTALVNELDFHPHSIWHYLSKTKPGLEKLLLRAPDALFDPAWLNTEYFQRDRPPSPYFKSFDGEDKLKHQIFDPSVSFQISFIVPQGTGAQKIQPTSRSSPARMPIITTITGALDQCAVRVKQLILSKVAAL
jgi:hypothetical protein